MRIVSLLPSATEIICEIGLADQLVGVTHECDDPPQARVLPKVTQTHIPTEATSREIDDLVRNRMLTRRALYSLDTAMLDRLAPDLIVTQALCDVCAVDEAEVSAAACQLPGRPRVINLEPTRLSHVFDCMQRVGEAAGVSERAAQSVRRLRSRVEIIAETTQRIKTKPRVVLLEWIDPPFSCGHWSPELVELAGGVELIGRAGERSRGIAWQEIVDADPDVMLIACCGFDIARTRRDLPILARNPGFRELRCVQKGRVFVTDGNAYFSRPGPRLVDSVEILAHALHPQHVPKPPTAMPAEIVSVNHYEALL